MNQKFTRVLTISSVLLLASCGDGWEFKKSDSHFPYGNQRTAGSGVAYVLAKMMPEKELKIEPVAEVAPAPTPEPVVQMVQPKIQPADTIFEEVQTKGGVYYVEKANVQVEDITPNSSGYVVPPLVIHEDHASAVTAPSAPVATPAQVISKVVAPTAAVPVAVAPPPPVAKAPIVIETTKSATVETTLQPVKGAIEATSSSATSFSGLSEAEAAEAMAKATPHAGLSSSLSAEDYIMYAPKTIDVPEVQILQAPVSISEIEERAALRAKEHVVEIYESSAEQASNNIISPKTDTVEYKSYGQETLEEIYKNQF